MRIIDIKTKGFQGYWQELWVNGVKVDEAHDFSRESIIDAANAALINDGIKIDFEDVEEEVEGMYG